MENHRMLEATEPGRCYFSCLGFVFVFLLLLLSGFVVPAIASQDPFREAAESFLELLDAGNYQQAWMEGNEFLHVTTSVDRWADEKRVQRDLLGHFEKRFVRTVVTRQTLAGFPDGVYGVLVTECQFEKKQRGVEIVTLGKDLYGSWRVISYDLR